MNKLILDYDDYRNGNGPNCPRKNWSWTIVKIFFIANSVFVKRENQFFISLNEKLLKLIRKFEQNSCQIGRSHLAQRESVFLCLNRFIWCFTSLHKVNIKENTDSYEVYNKIVI